MTTAGGLPPPIGLTWNLTYACNLACALCLSCSDRRDPRELSTPECETVVDELQRLHISTVHIGGGEPTVRPDFWHLLDYAANHQIGITFTTNGVRLTPNRARRLAAMPNVNVQVSVNGATAKVNDVLRGPGAFVMAWQAMDNLAEAGVRSFTISVTVTSYNVDHLDAFKRMANHFGARLRIVLPRSSGPHREIPNTLQPTVDQQHRIHQWLSANDDVAPARHHPTDEHAAWLIDPIGDVYTRGFLAGNIRHRGGFERVWRSSQLFAPANQGKVTT